MTRDEIKQLFRDDRDSFNKPKTIMTKLNTIYDDFEKQLLKKDIEIVRQDGMIEAFKSEIKRLHPNTCNCTICTQKEQNHDN